MDTKKILKKYNLEGFLDKNEDQHFMIDNDVLKKMVEYGKINKNDDTLEIGSGVGNLTEKIAERSNRVYAVEKDSKLISIAMKELEEKNIQYINDDILKIDLPPFNKSVSNMPYRRVEPITEKLADVEFERGIFTVPYKLSKKLKEDLHESLYSMKFNSFYDIDILDDVSRNKFYPKPRHKTSLISIKPKEFTDLDKEMGYYITDKLFKEHKKKKTKNALVYSLREYHKERYNKTLSNGKVRYVISEFDIDDKTLEKRVPQLSSKEFGKIIENLTNLSF